MEDIAETLGLKRQSDGEWSEEVSECIRHVKSKHYSFPALWIEMADKSIEPTPVKSEVL